MNSNILLNKLPLYTPSGLKLRTDFRESIKFELLMQDSSINDKDKIEIALNLYYYELIPNIKSAIKDIIWFYRGGKEEKKTSQKEEMVKKREKQIYSYEFDADYIYSAFLQQYKIDLNSIKYLHWWKFKALLEGLDENTRFVKIMGYRAIDLGQIKDKKEKKHYKKLQDLYALPDMRTEEEKEADFGRAFW